MRKIREPSVENRYNLSPADIHKAVILDPDKLHREPFKRNDIFGAWYLSGNTAKTGADEQFGMYNSFTIMFHDKDSKLWAGKIRLILGRYNGMSGYSFKSFFDYSEIGCEIDLEIQEKLLSTYNWLIDSGVITIPHM